jgi:hypothetical protein
MNLVDNKAKDLVKRIQNMRDLSAKPEGKRKFVNTNRTHPDFVLDNDFPPMRNIFAGNPNLAQGTGDGPVLGDF